MVELVSMLRVVIEPHIETEEWLNGLDEVLVGNRELIAEIDKAAILVEEAKFHAIHGKGLYLEVGWMFLQQVKELHIHLRHISSTRGIIECKVLSPNI